MPRVDFLSSRYAEATWWLSLMIETVAIARSMLTQADVQVPHDTLSCPLTLCYSKHGRCVCVCVCVCGWVGGAEGRQWGTGPFSALRTDAYNRASIRCVLLMPPGRPDSRITLYGAIFPKDRLYAALWQKLLAPLGYRQLIGSSYMVRSHRDFKVHMHSQSKLRLLSSRRCSFR